MNMLLGAIQIIRDTLTGGGLTKCHVNFFAVLNSDLKAGGGRPGGQKRAQKLSRII